MGDLKKPYIADINTILNYANDKEISKKDMREELLDRIDIDFSLTDLSRLQDVKVQRLKKIRSGFICFIKLYGKEIGLENAQKELEKKGIDFSQDCIPLTINIEMTFCIYYYSEKFKENHCEFLEIAKNRVFLYSYDKYYRGEIKTSNSKKEAIMNLHFTTWNKPDKNGKIQKYDIDIMFSIYHGGSLYLNQDYKFPCYLAGKNRKGNLRNYAGLCTRIENLESHKKTSDKIETYRSIIPEKLKILDPISSVFIHKKRFNITPFVENNNIDTILNGFDIDLLELFKGVYECFTIDDLFLKDGIVRNIVEIGRNLICYESMCNEGEFKGYAYPQENNILYIEMNKVKSGVKRLSFNKVKGEKRVIFDKDKRHYYLPLKEASLAGGQKATYMSRSSIPPYTSSGGVFFRKLSYTDSDEDFYLKQQPEVYDTTEKIIELLQANGNESLKAFFLEPKQQLNLKEGFPDVLKELQ